MSFHTIAKNSVSSTDSTKKSTTATEQLNSTAKVFCEACNQIVKAYLTNYHEKNMFQTINLSFAQKVIKKTKISFSQLVVTLVYLNRYYQSCTIYNKHIPGHEEAVIPSLSHVVLLCIIQAERYITDIPHKLSWWAGICAGQTKSSDINKWQRDFFDTIDYKLYVHPEKDFNIFKVEVKRLAARLFNNSVVMPPQFRRSVCSGTQLTPTSAPSSQIQQLPSQPNIISTSSSNNNVNTVQPRILLSPLYSGNSTSTQQQQQQPILSSQTNMLTSPLASVHSDNSVGPCSHSHHTQNLGVPVLNITNTNLTTSPVELSDNSIINQTRSPNSLYNNSLPNDTRQLNATSPLPPTQNPSHLMVQNIVRSPIHNQSTTTSTSLLVLNNNQQPKTETETTTSPVQYGIKMTSSPVQAQTIVDSPLDMTKKEEIVETTKTIPSRPIKRKRKQNNKKENSSSFRFMKNLIVSSQIQVQGPSDETHDNQKIFSTEVPSFPYIDKGKHEEVSSSESDSSSHPFRIDERAMTSGVGNSFLESIETIPNSNTTNVMNPLDNNVASSSEEIIASSLLLAGNNSTSITLIPVSPPLTPQ
ncbi:hypothetical protein PIROE2DRAFT_10532 [Piromyces sp. E2]|nr:hypothetical protein PIROE2DRAFT_10532 [Piromyces sp. E2]|eukprot:OUM63007.1 hypothetical protein PIROE2DRAFT_10532 [Piromyces sp. E2]